MVEDCGCISNIKHIFNCIYLQTCLLNSLHLSAQAQLNYPAIHMNCLGLGAEGGGGGVKYSLMGYDTNSIQVVVGTSLKKRRMRESEQFQNLGSRMIICIFCIENILILLRV